jgi:hypothetical protein
MTRDITDKELLDAMQVKLDAEGPLSRSQLER